jgi:hypothetical protein
VPDEILAPIPSDLSFEGGNISTWRQAFEEQDQAFIKRERK